MNAVPLSRPVVDDEIEHAVLAAIDSRLPETESLVDEILTLPISAGHTVAEIDVVAAAVREFFGV